MPVQPRKIHAVSEEDLAAPIDVRHPTRGIAQYEGEQAKTRV
jgi:hypothetical protein